VLVAKGQRTRDDIRAWIEDRAMRTNESGAAIAVELSRDRRLLGHRDPPNERTVQGIVKEARWRDSSGEWSLANPDFSGADAAKVLPVLRELLKRTSIRALTNTEARWIVKLHDALPNRSDNPLILYFYVRRFVRATRPDAPAGMRSALDREIALSDDLPEAEAEVIAGGQRYEGPEDWGRPLHDPERQAAARRSFEEQLRREGKIV
jgi:hypothetical protein